MAQPRTAKFGKMLVKLGKYPVVTTAVTNLSKTNPAVCTVAPADITKFISGKEVDIAGAVGVGLVNANGKHTIGTVTATTFQLVGVDTSTASAAQTSGLTAMTKNTAGTITYAAPCGFTSKNCTISKNLAEVSIPDCDYPDAPIWIGRDVQSQSCTISGDGVAAAESVPDWDDAAMSTDPVPMIVEISFDPGKKTISGNFHLDSEAFAAEQGGRVTLAVNAQSDGPVSAVWAAA